MLSEKNIPNKMFKCIGHLTNVNIVSGDSGI